MQHYFCVHPTAAANNSCKHDRYLEEGLGKLMSVTACGRPIAGSGAALRPAP